MTKKPEELPWRARKVPETTAPQYQPAPGQPGPPPAPGQPGPPPPPPLWDYTHRDLYDLILGINGMLQESFEVLWARINELESIIKKSKG